MALTEHGGKPDIAPDSAFFSNISWSSAGFGHSYLPGHFPIHTARANRPQFHCESIVLRKIDIHVYLSRLGTFAPTV
jgi:hypothetical protein